MRSADMPAGSAPTEPSEDDLVPLRESSPDPGRGRRLRRVLIVLGGLVFTLVLIVVGGFFYLTGKLGDNVQRYPDVFKSLDPSQRPAAGPLTFLLVGTDTRSPEPTTGTDAAGADFAPGHQRSDVIMIVRFNGDRNRANIISIPRDSWVPIPGRGTQKINAAYSFGGPALLVQTIESLTGIRIDHFGVIDFAGFESMTDAVGGIDVQVAAATSNGALHLHEGLNHLNGVEALLYVRQRYNLPRGDLDRAQRQQNALRAMLDKAANVGLLSSPARTYDLLDAVTRSVSVDDTLDNGALRSLALDLRNMRTSGITFAIAPIAGLGQEGAQAVVYLDSVRAGELWTAVRDGVVDAYLARYPADRLPSTPP